jgi:hypothetical protein
VNRELRVSKPDLQSVCGPFAPRGRTGHEDQSTWPCKSFGLLVLSSARIALTPAQNAFVYLRQKKRNKVVLRWFRKWPYLAAMTAGPRMPIRCEAHEFIGAWTGDLNPHGRLRSSDLQDDAAHRTNSSNKFKIRYINPHLLS